MTKKTLAVLGGRNITARFKSEEEYDLFCQAIAKVCLEEILSSLTEEELIKLKSDTCKQ